MLVLSRKARERIMIGDEVVITVVRVQQHVVRIGIEAPRHLKIIREGLEPPAPSAELREMKPRPALARELEPVPAA